jgi:hypothetical protein
MLESDVETLNELDNHAASACQAGDDEHFHDAFLGLIEFVRANGRRVPDDQLQPSDVIIPPPDSTLEDARAEFSADGLIPG